MKDIKGVAAAGGLGAGSIAFLQKLTKGIDVVLDTDNFDELVSKADIVFEQAQGKFDSQSLHGKE